MIIIDINKAKDIQKNIFRTNRIELFKNLDLEFTIALENNDTIKIQEIKNKKDFLRNCPNHPAIENCTTVEELKNLDLVALMEQA